MHTAADVHTGLRHTGSAISYWPVMRGDPKGIFLSMRPAFFAGSEAGMTEGLPCGHLL